MRLFISYARVDKPYCVQIVELLDAHETWFDQRLYAGQHWWKEILRRLDWCEGFVYLLSPDSLSSVYCQKEFELAQGLGRHIIPVLIHQGVTLPPSLADVQYADFSKGPTPEAVRILLNSILMAEREKNGHLSLSPDTIAAGDIRLSPQGGGTVIGAALVAMENGQFDQAVFLLRHAKEKQLISRFIDVDLLLREAEAGLDRQAYLREAEREYQQIAELLKYPLTQKMGCEALEAFRQAFPDYDPDSLIETCADVREEESSLPDLIKRLEPRKPPFKLPNLEWCDIPAGNVLIEPNGNNGAAHVAQQPRLVYVDAFQVSKYPITNAQYQVFLDDPGGYADEKWWAFSPHAQAWRADHPAPQPSQFKGDERPREMVSWYDAMAFCYWLSDRLGVTVMLPSENQWQRAARGDDCRAYPWGDKFDKDRCNTNESKLKMTTLVMRYPSGTSPFGVFDMAGNVWEWCLNTRADQSDTPEITSDSDRVVHGGSYIGPAQRARITFRYYLKPKSFFSSIGFRVICRP